MTAILHARNLTKRYGKTVALDGVNLSLASGRIVGLIGPNGAGKTTLMSSILGLTAFEGDLRVMGHNPRLQRDEVVRHVGFIADVSVLPRWLSVGEAVDFLEGTHAKFSRERCMAFLEKTTLKPSMKVRQMSKGMVAQLHLALVMAIDCPFLVLDEPTLGLDILYRQQFYHTLMTDYFDQEKTILIATHQVEEVEHLLTDVIFLNQGKVVLEASLEQMGERYCHVLAAPGQAETLRAMGPLDERTVFGKTVFLFDGKHPAELSALGEVLRPSVADVFVALMKGTYA